MSACVCLFVMYTFVLADRQSCPGRSNHGSRRKDQLRRARETGCFRNNINQSLLNCFGCIIVDSILGLMGDRTLQTHVMSATFCRLCRSSFAIASICHRTFFECYMFLFGLTGTVFNGHTSDLNILLDNARNVVVCVKFRTTHDMSDGKSDSLHSIRKQSPAQSPKLCPP
jgi:hypothetical protein